MNLAHGKLRRDRDGDGSRLDNELQAGLGNMAKAYPKEDKTNK